MTEEKDIQSLKREVTKFLKENGTYTDSDVYIVQMFAETWWVYRNLFCKWRQDNYRTHILSKGSLKKNPVADQISTLRKDLITLTDRLAINPKSILGDSQVTDLEDLENFVSKVETQHGK